VRPPDRVETGAPGAPAPSPHLASRQRAADASAGDNYLLALLAVGAVAIILLGMRSSVYDLDRYSVPKAAALHLVALLSLPVLLARWRRLRLGWPDALLAGFVAWSGVSGLLARNYWLALSGFGLSFSGLVVFLAARQAARSRGFALAAALAFAAALGSALGVAQAYGANWSFLGTTRPPGGTFGNRNFLAHLTAIGVPLLLLVRSCARRRQPAFFAALGLAIAAAAIVLTRSRAAWLGLAAAMLVMIVGAILGWRALRSADDRPRRRLRGAILALALGAAAAIALPNQLDWRASNPYAQTLSRLTDYRGGSGRGRLLQYRNSARMLRFDPVFGVGPGNWFVHYPRVTTPGDPAFDSGDPIPTNPWPSSDWVTFFVERGPVGALLLLGFMAAATLACLGSLRGGDRYGALAAVALLGALAAAFVTGLFDAVLLLPAPTFFVFAAAGALLPAPRRLALDRPPGGGTRALASIGAMVLALAIAAAAAGQLYALVITQDSTSRRTVDAALTWDPGDYRLNLLMLERGSCRARIRYARAAAALLPYHAAPRRALRECGAR
jgi:O-antigen ligase